MEDMFAEITRGQNDAQSQRKKGDALLKAGKRELALKAYEEGATTLAALLEKFPTTEGEEAVQRLLRERAEILGSYGGLMQRLDRPLDALKSYQDGGVIEEQIHSCSTYNRLNAIKAELLTGQKTLEDLRENLKKLVNVIEATLRANPSASDSGWLWADLGDSLALLGDMDPAQRAYVAFLNKSGTKSPERTLDVLRSIAAKLKETGSADASQLDAAIRFLESRLSGAAFT